MAESDFWNKIKAKIIWLRIQPESVKVRYVWGLSIIFFVIVALLWLGLFRKYERKLSDSGKNSELIKEEERIKKDIESKIKVPGIKLPEKIISSVSPELSPMISPEVSPEVSQSLK